MRFLTEFYNFDFLCYPRFVQTPFSSRLKTALYGLGISALPKLYCSLILGMLYNGNGKHTHFENHTGLNTHLRHTREFRDQPSPSTRRPVSVVRVDVMGYISFKYARPSRTDDFAIQGPAHHFPSARCAFNIWCSPKLLSYGKPR